MTPNSVEEQIARMKSVTSARTDAQLAAVLGISSGAIANARKRSNIPRKWYNRLATACAQISGGILGGAASVAGVVPPDIAMNAAILAHDLIKSMTPEQISEWVKTGFTPNDTLPDSSLPDSEKAFDVRHSTGSKYPLFRMVRSGRETPEAFSDSFIQKKGGSENLALLRASGDTLAPEIRDGDTVMIDLSFNDLVPGRIFAVEICGTVSLLRAHMGKSGIVLRWNNASTSSDDIYPGGEGQILILGQVVALLREWSTF